MQAIFGLELLARTRVHPRRINRLAVGAHDEQPLGRAVEFAKPDGQTAHIHAVVLVAERAGSRIRRFLRERRYGLLKPELSTNPKCYYVGLDLEVR